MVSLPQIEADFVSWIRASSQARALSQMAVRDGMRDQGVEVHPKTVEGWFRGTAMPAYENLVALALVLHELPPLLARVCPPDIARVGEAEDRSPDTVGSGPVREARPSPRRRA